MDSTRSGLHCTEKPASVSNDSTSTPPVAECWCHTTVRITKMRYVWTISNFSFCREDTGEILKSSAFSSGPNDKLKWCLRINPKGLDDDSKEYLSLYLLLINSGNNKEARAKFRFSILNGRREETKAMESQRAYRFVQGKDWGFKKFIRRDILMDEANGLLPNDQLTVLCEVSVVGETVSESGQINTQAISIPNCNLNEDMGDLLRNETFADVTLVIVEPPPGFIEPEFHNRSNQRLTNEALATTESDSYEASRCKTEFGTHHDYDTFLNNTITAGNEGAGDEDNNSHAGGGNFGFLGSTTNVNNNEDDTTTEDYDVNEDDFQYGEDDEDDDNDSRQNNSDADEVLDDVDETDSLMGGAEALSSMRSKNYSVNGVARLASNSSISKRNPTTSSSSNLSPNEAATTTSASAGACSSSSNSARELLRAAKNNAGARAAIRSSHMAGNALRHQSESEPTGASASNAISSTEVNATSGVAADQRATSTTDSSSNINNSSTGHHHQETSNTIISSQCTSTTNTESAADEAPNQSDSITSNVFMPSSQQLSGATVVKAPESCNGDTPTGGNNRCGVSSTLNGGTTTSTTTGNNVPRVLREFRVHKAILAARSPVFQAMFGHGMEESREGRVEISDLKPECVADVLQYIYTGRVEHIDVLAPELLAAADKYQLDQLKIMCEERLVQGLCVENACDTLALADRHDAGQLKMHTLDFIMLHAEEICDTEGFDELSRLQPRLLYECFRKLAVQHLPLRCCSRKRPRTSS